MINQDIEASVIGGLLLDGLTSDAGDVLATLRPEAFATVFYRETYKVIKTQAKTRGMIDCLMVAEAMGEDRFADVMSTARKCPSAANLKGYALIVAEYHARRELLALWDERREIIANGRREVAAAAMDELINKSSDVRRIRNEIMPVHIGDMLTDYTELLEKRVANGDESDTLKTGIAELDEITGGINPVDLVIVAARPGMGKTEFALTVANGVASQHITGTDNKRGVLIFSMEMDALQVIERQLAGAGNLPVSKLRNPARMNDEDWARTSEGIKRLTNLDVWVVDASNLSVEQISAISTRHKKRYPSLSLIMVDYLGLIDKPKADRNDLAIAHISGSLKRLAKEMKTPVMSLSQLSRDVEKRPNKRPVSADLRDSGSVEQDADSIIMLYRDAVYNESSPAEKYAEIIITKNRFGKLGTVYQLFKDGHFLPTDQDEAKKACAEKRQIDVPRKFAKGVNV